MARSPRLVSQQPTPATGSCSSSDAGFRDAFSRTLERLGPGLCRDLQQRLRAKCDSAAARIQRLINEERELWQALIEEPLPCGYDEIRVAAVRFGMPPTVVLSGDFTLADVTMFMAGKRLAAADELRDRSRAVAAEVTARCAAVSATTNVETPASTQAAAAADEYAGVARRLSNNARRAMAFLHEMNASSRGDKLTRQFIADELGVEVDDMRVVRNELGKTGKALLESVDGCRGGWWLTPEGVRVAERVAATRPKNIAAAAAAERA